MIRLSVCMIVRNEGGRLARALESVRGIADEIIVTDTGSTDDTVDIARRFGAVVSHFTWCDDFAAARNAGAALARGEWVFWLDGDERLKPGTECRLLDDIADPETVALQFIREENYFQDRENWTSEMYILRAVRRDLPVTYVGRIHEHYVPWPVDLALRTGKRVRLSGARIDHWGYTSDRVVEKCLRSAHLCELELKERPGQLYYLIELARTLFMVNTHVAQVRAGEVLREAVNQMLAARDDPFPPCPLVSMLIEQLLALSNQSLVSVDELLTLSRRWFPKNLPLIWAASRIHADRGDWPAVESGLRRLLELLARGEQDFISPFDPRIGEDARFNLAVALARQTKLAEAQAVFETMLESPRRKDEAAGNLAAVKDLRRQYGV